MKKFFFSLNTVLNYKEQALESLRGEHARSLMKVRECEEAIEVLEEQYRACVDEFEEKEKTGISISGMKVYESYLEGLGIRILENEKRLKVLQREEEKKRDQVVEAKKESTSIQKLKEKKQQEYRRQEQKENELLVEEFVSTRNAMAKLNG
ncbi:MAG TPA: flagellar export protein FliJ [Candidatus Blautia stercoravium]|nr:flagellar export protein FliJ [Candidatus Blautia stercoravium]